MSLKAKIEAVVYAAEEPVTLAQLSGIFASELPPAEPEPMRSVESVIEEGFLEASGFLTGDPNHLTEMAILTAREKQEEEAVASDPQAAEAEAKRLARQRERQVRDQIKAIVDELIEEYATSDRGMEIREVAGGYRIATKPEYHDAVRAFAKSLKPPMKLSLQALETLAVIAYKQPVTAPEVGEIRGVDSGGVLGGLISRKLITTAGRKQVIGRPILYKTTREFLLRFGLKDINELPSIEEFEKLAGDIELGDEESTAEATALPFEGGEDIEDSAETSLEAVEANAGEAGLAVETAATSTPPASETEPEIIPLGTDIPETPEPHSVEVTPASHPTVAIEETDAKIS